MKSVIKNYYGLDYKIYENGEIFGMKKGKLSQRINEDGYAEVTLGCGEINGRAKLNSKDVLTIRNRYKNGESISFISKSLGVPYSTIFNVAHNKTWKNI